MHPDWRSKKSVRYELLTDVKIDKVATSPITKKPPKRKTKQQKAKTSRESLNEAANAPPRQRRSQKLSIKNGGGDMSEIHINSRQITTCTAGLFSSVLSAARTSVTADEKAIKQARLLTDALRTTVGDANTTRRLATQFANLALLLVEEGDFDQEFRRMVYMNFYQATRSTRGQFGEASGSSSSAAMKTWMWVLYMATDYENKSVAKNKHPIIGYNAGVRPRSSNQGKIDNPNELIAFPHDTAIGSLVQLTDDNRPLGNLMLFGRRI